jgi:hypothetical protein
MKRCLFVAVPLAVVAGAVLLNGSRGQSPSNLLQPRPQGVVEYPLNQYGGGAGFGLAAPAHRTRSEIGRLVAELRDASEDAKKTEITKKLEAAVTKAFDEDQKARETELTRLEERLKKLRAQLDRRAKAKSDIIQLQLKVLANEAEGLGFSGASLDHGAGGVIAWPAYPGVQAVPLVAPAPAAAPALP